jgi:hypothetical protein
MDNLSLHQELELTNIKNKCYQAYRVGDGLDAVNLLIDLLKLSYAQQNVLKEMVETNLGIVNSCNS